MFFVFWCEGLCPDVDVDRYERRIDINLIFELLFFNLRASARQAR